MWTEEDNQRVIDQTFDGDTALYLADLHESRRKVIHWDSLVASASVLPELEVDAQELIKQLLGYLPQALLTLQVEPFIRALLHNYRSGGLTTDELFDQAEEYIKPIRNADPADNTCLTYERRLYRKYFLISAELSNKVRDRLTKFLGYEPALEHSLVAELNLYNCLIDDTMHFSETLSRADIQAIAIIKYRETLLAKGIDAADASPLVAMDLIAEHCLKKAKYSHDENVKKIK